MSFRGTHVQNRLRKMWNETKLIGGEKPLKSDNDYDKRLHKADGEEKTVTVKPHPS